MAEKGLDVEQLSQLTDITETRIKSFKYGFTKVNREELDVLCRVLGCQPCDIIEYRKTVQGGHWEWIND
jgi:DNA-binding Xre family transcriptional regulator